MLVRYWEKLPLTPDNWRRELAAMEVSVPAALAAIAQIISEKGAATVSCYQFQALAGEAGSIVVCHDLHRGVMSLGTSIRWGHWDEAYDILTLDEYGEKFNFDGEPVYEGDEGSCSLGNF
jgi:hypothetical protein